MNKFLSKFLFNKNILNRQNCLNNFLTGYLILDLLFPLSCGSRILIAGKKGTGKSRLMLDIIISSFKTNSLGQLNIFNTCIKPFFVIVKIGGPEKYIKINQKYLIKNGLKGFFKYYNASSSKSLSTKFLSPLESNKIAQLYSNSGIDVIIFYDSLSNHAEFYRELMLTLNLSPGREAFPAGIFNVHSSLLEKSGKLGRNYFGGSLTSLPLLELPSDNISGYLCTNLISITDGQWILDSSLSSALKFPSINISKSVSRIGGKARTWLYSMFYEKINKILNEGFSISYLKETGISLTKKDENTYNLYKDLKNIFFQKSPNKYFINIGILLYFLLRIFKNSCINNSILKYSYFYTILNKKLSFFYILLNYIKNKHIVKNRKIFFFKVFNITFNYIFLKMKK